MIVLLYTACLPNIRFVCKMMITLSVFVAGLLQRHQHARRLSQPGAGGVRLSVAVAALHHRLDVVVETRLQQALGGVLHADVRASHHLLGRQTAPGGRYQRRHRFARVRRRTAIVRQHHYPGRRLPLLLLLLLLWLPVDNVVVAGQRERALGTPLARRTHQRYGDQRLQLARRRPWM